jgi:rhamnosyltransferase
MNLNKVAVLMAAYNGADYISQQIDSIVNQKGVDVDLYISVDLSSDNTYSVCCDYANNFPNIRVLDYGARFGSAANNFFNLISFVRDEHYDFFALSDQDDVWSSDKLIHAIDLIASTSSAAYSSDVIAFWPTGKNIYIKKSYPQTRWDYFFESPGPGCTFVYFSC